VQAAGDYNIATYRPQVIAAPTFMVIPHKSDDGYHQGSPAHSRRHLLM